MNYNVDNSYIYINFDNGVKLKFYLEQNNLNGIKDVIYKDKEMRKPDEFIMPEICTPDGKYINRLEFVFIKQENDKIVIRTKPYFKVSHRMEWAEHALHLRISTSSWSRELEVKDDCYLDWIIKEEKEEYDGITYRGFSYQFGYFCPNYEIYQIEDKATWEIGGNIVGNTFIMRGSFQNPIFTFDKENSYYSGWNLPGIANPHIFQHLPLYSQMQGFTFQFDKENILLTVHERPSHVRSLFVKNHNDDKLLHFNQFCFNLTHKITTPARKILFAEHNKNRTEMLNHFLRVREKIQQDIRTYYNIKHDKTRPSAHVETWEIAKVENFKNIFKKLNEWGIKRAFIMPLWRSNETDVVPRFKEDKDRFNFMGNMCCPLELEIADCYGGWEGFKDIMSEAAKLDVETYMWYGSHFSSLSPLEKKINDLFARDVSGQCNRNNYGHVLFAVNQNSKKYQEYLFDKFKKAKECGLKGVFRDSHFNMATDTINYLHIPYDQFKKVSTTADQVGFIKKEELISKDIIETMHDTEAYIQSVFQNKLGMLYYVESQGVLGTPMAGTDYEFVRNNEFIFSDMETGMNLNKVIEYGDEPLFVYFKGLSTRLIYQINIEVNKYPDKDAIEKWFQPEKYVPLIKAFNKIEDYLDKMYILENDKGILWKDKKQEVFVVFAYKDFDYNTQNKKVYDAIQDTWLDKQDVTTFKKMGIYLIEDDK